MVKVPTAIDAGIGLVKNTALQAPTQSTSVSADSFGAQSGRGIQGLGQAAQQAQFAFKRVQDEEDKATAYEAFAQGSEKTRTLLNDEDEGLYQRNGSKAAGVYNDALKGMDQIYTDSTQNLSQGAKDRFNQMWRSKRERTLESVSRFEVQKRNEFKHNAADATLKTTINDAIDSFNNPAQIKDSLMIGEQTIRDSMDGQPKEAIDLKLGMFKTDIHSSIINRMAIEDPLSADQYYKKVKKDITGKQQVALEKMLEQGTQRSAAQAATDQIVTKNESFEDQLKAARKIKDSGVRDNVVQRVKQRFNENKTIQAERSKEVASEAWKVVLETNNVDAVPIDQWAALDGNTQKSLVTYVNRRRNPETNILKWKELNDMMIAEPEKFQEANLLEYVNYLSQSDFKKFSENQQKISRGDETIAVKSRNNRQIAADRLNAIGITTSSRATRGDKEKEALFMRRFEEELAIFSEENNRAPRANETEEIVDGLLIKGNGGFFRGADFAFELEPGQPFEVDDLDDIPVDKRRQAVIAIEQAGAIATEENILKMINAKIKNDSR